MPTSDKKMKPVIHCIASVGSGCLCWIHPQQIGMKTNLMFKQAVEAICPSGNDALKGNLTYFIDCGYLEISKNQNVENVTNLIQLMLQTGIKFLGMIPMF